MNRPALARLAGTLLALACFVAPGARAWADEPASSDPWPLPSGAPAEGAEEARRTYDALDARRSAALRAQLAPMVDAIVRTTPDPGGTVSAGRSAVTPAQSMRGLKQAAKASQDADARTVPEIMQVLAGTAFDGGILAPDVHVLPGPSGKVDRVLKAELKPQSIDDRPYVLRPGLLLRPSAVKPPPPPRTEPEPEGNRIVKGVRIEVDEALLRRALEAPGAPPEGPELAALEERLLAAPDGASAARLLAEFARAKKQALLAARTDGGSVPLARVSLKALLAEAGSAAGGTRTLGGLTRIVGVAVGRSGGGAEDDVTLLGLRESGDPAIPLEALALALRYVWREGRVPGCSLDPDPKNPAGAQHVRLFGIAEDSAFAKVMLEADYAMKKVVGRAPGAPRIEGLVDLPEALAGEGMRGGASLSNRFWLTPAPPGPGDVLLAADGAAALFDARVTVRTEEMREDFAVGRGRSSPASARVARSLTERYADLARALPVFAELRGLFDAVYAAQVLRYLVPSHPLLERAASRPHAPVSVASTYAGIHVVHPLHGGFLVLEGGCEAATRLAAGALLDVRHPAFDAIETDGATTAAVPRVVAGGRATDIEDLLLAAQAALTEERFEQAEDLATQALDLEHDDPSALALRGVARVRAGRGLSGVLDALEAHRRAPGEPLFEANLRALLADLGDEQAFVGLSGPGAEVLHATYLAKAGVAGLERKWAEAAQAADRALKVLPASEDARVLRTVLVWLAGDLVQARRLAEEGAALLPRSADAQAVTGWVTAMQGDFAAARQAFDRAIALRPAADTLGSRAVLRLLASDLVGAGQDALAALRLDPTDWGTQLALQALRRAACLGHARAQPEIAAQLRLPAEAQLAIFEAQQSLTLDQTEAAALAYERALTWLTPEHVDAQVLADSHAREMVTLMLGRCLGLARPHDPEARERAEELWAEIEQAHPTWVTPRWIRAIVAQKTGDIEAALAALALCHDADPSDDPLLVQYVPPTRAAFGALVSLLECTLPLMSPGGPRSPGPEALERLRGAYRASPSAGAADALAEGLAGLIAGEASPTGQAAIARMRAASDALVKEAQRPLAPEEVLVRSALLGGRVGELSQAPDQDAAFAPVVRALVALAPAPDVYESLTTMVAETRKNALMTAVRQFVKQVDADPRGRIAQRIASRDLAAARRIIDDVVRPARDRAAALGEPLLEHFVDLALMGMVDGVEAAALDERLKRVRAVLDLALDPVKIKRLQATEAELVARKTAIEGDLGGRALERTAALRARLKTPTDAKTQQLLQREMAQGAARQGRAAEPTDPLDVTRQAEINLRASLEALKAPLPEGLK